MKDIANKKIFSGVVVSNKMDKTATVLVKSLVRHPLYQRIIKQNRKFYAHDEKNECQVGDEVMIMETRPISKNKRWKIMEILKKAE